MNKNAPLQTISEIQSRLNIFHDVVYHELTGLCPLYSPIRHDFFSIILFKNAKGIHVIDGIKHEIGMTQLHILFPGQVHNWDYNSNADIYQLFISGEMFEKLEGFMTLPVFLFKKHPVITLDETEFEILIREFKDVEDELKSPSPVMKEIIYSKMKIIVQKISKEVQKRTEFLEVFENHPQLFDFLMLLNSQYKNQKNKKYYAGELGINENYLNILCKKYFNKSAKEMINNQILEKIKDKLCLSETALKEIAFEFGFQNYGHFSSFLKKATGMTPKKYREKHPYIPLMKVNQ